MWRGREIPTPNAAVLSKSAGSTTARLLLPILGRRPSRPASATGNKGKVQEGGTSSCRPVLSRTMTRDILGSLWAHQLIQAALRFLTAPEVVGLAFFSPSPWRQTPASPLDSSPMCWQGMRIVCRCRLPGVARVCRDRPAYLDLRNSDENATIHRLGAEADVFASTYRSSVNRRFGLTPIELASQSPRGIVCMTANAYGHEGPWSERPGFDQNGQVASGFAVKEGGSGAPKFSPVFYSADLMTGYFAAAGMIAALLRRSIEGGSYNVKLSLTRSAMWVQDLDSSRCINSLPRQKTGIHRNSA